MRLRPICFAILALSSVAGPIAGCSSSTSGDSESASRNAYSERSIWAVDMAKAKSLYGATSKYFFGLSPEEVKIPGLSKPVWDQMHLRENDHTLAQEHGDEVAVILEDGTKIDPPGYINIVPLLKDTDPTKQVHLRKIMQNGDVLVYFHPEFTGGKDFIERRASHVAMHYDLKDANGKEYVHHIDNPNSYGPRYNHSPSRHMPFHVFRFSPKADKAFKTRGADASISIAAAQAKSYAANARNWALITNDLSPFAGFFELNLKTKQDLGRFASSALNGQQIPPVYCSGLAFTNLNLGLNYPLNEGSLGSDLWSSFSTKSYGFSDTNESLGAERLKDGANLKPLDKLVFEPYGATDILNNWVEVYMSALPTAARQQVLAQPPVQQTIIQGMSQLEWGDSAAPEKTQRADSSVASLVNVGRWAKAYGLGAEKTASFIEGDASLKSDIDRLSVSTSNLTPMQVIQAVEAKVIKNRFVPPRIWIDEADREDSNLVYVATVVNCELLSASDGTAKDACAGAGGGSNEFGEGASDTSTYPEMGMPNGGERTHRRFDATPGPATIGADTTITVRASQSDASDSFFVLHLPEHWAGDSTTSMGLREFTRYCNERFAANSTCSPEFGIFLDPTKVGATAGPVTDATYSFKLLNGVCTAVDESTLDCPIAQKVNGKWKSVGNKQISRNSRGLWDVTMVDRGEKSDPATIEKCGQCTTGGGHFNGWTLLVR